MGTNNDQNKDKKKSNILGSTIFFVGFIGALVLVSVALSSTTDFVKNLPWYISIPIIGSMAFFIYRIGKEKNWF